jgi:hypothetical protein
VDLEEIRREEVDWIYQAHDRIQWSVSLNTLMNFRSFLKGRGFSDRPGDHHSVIIKRTEGVNGIIRYGCCYLLNSSSYCMYQLLYHTKILHSAHRVFLCISCGSCNKQGLLP